jgi:ureidoacrylate peracid hydrolase
MDPEKLKVKVDPQFTAVLTIDMQKDYCCAGGIFDKMGFDIETAAKLGPRLNEFVGRARKVVRQIIHVRMELNPHLRSPVLAEQYQRCGLQRKLDPVYSDFYGVTPVEADIIIPKYRYSAFVSTYLDQCLRSNGIKSLVLTGLATNVCLESTARDGFMKDYYIVVPEDLTEATSEKAKKSSLLNINTFFGEVVNSRDLLSCWRCS